MFPPALWILISERTYCESGNEQKCIFYKALVLQNILNLNKTFLLYFCKTLKVCHCQKVSDELHLLRITQTVVENFIISLGFIFFTVPSWYIKENRQPSGFTWKSCLGPLLRHLDGFRSSLTGERYKMSPWGNIRKASKLFYNVGRA